MVLPAPQVITVPPQGLPMYAVEPSTLVTARQSMVAPAQIEMEAQGSGGKLPPHSDGLKMWQGEGEGEALGEAEDDCDMEGEPVALVLRLVDAEGDCEALTVALVDTLALTLSAEMDTLAVTLVVPKEPETLGVTLPLSCDADTLAEGEVLPLAVGEAVEEAVADGVAEAATLSESDLERLAEGEAEADAVAEKLLVTEGDALVDATLMVRMRLSV